MLSKQELRREMRRRRRALTPEVRRRASQAVCRRILALPEVARHINARRTFAVYLAADDEIELSTLISALNSSLVPLVAPRWNGQTYTLCRLRANPDGTFQLRKGPHGIFEPLADEEVHPREVAVWVVPGLAFTAGGDRLGYGGGWYDRLLAEADLKAITLAAAYDFQMVNNLPVEKHDCKLYGVLYE